MSDTLDALGQLNDSLKRLKFTAITFLEGPSYKLYKCEFTGSIIPWGETYQILPKLGEFNVINCYSYGSTNSIQSLNLFGTFDQMVGILSLYADICILSENDAQNRFGEHMYHLQDINNNATWSKNALQEIVNRCCNPYLDEPVIIDDMTLLVEGTNPCYNLLRHVAILAHGTDKQKQKLSSF